MPLIRIEPLSTIVSRSTVTFAKFNVFWLKSHEKLTSVTFASFTTTSRFSLKLCAKLMELPMVTFAVTVPDCTLLEFPVRASPESARPSLSSSVSSESGVPSPSESNSPIVMPVEKPPFWL